MNSVSTLGMAFRTRSMVSHAQVEMARIGGEIGSGFKRDVAAAGGTRLGENIATRNLYDQVTESDKNISLLEMRLDAMASSFEEVEKVTSEFFGKLATQMGDSHMSGVLRQEAISTISRIVQAMNVSVGDRYLFSGVDVSSPPLQEADGVNAASGLSPLGAMSAMHAAVPPVDAASAQALADMIGAAFGGGTSPAGTGFEETFYKGTPLLDGGGTPNARVSGRIDQDRILDYGVQANDPAFRDVLKGLYMIASADVGEMPEEAREVYVAEAYGSIGRGLSAARASVAALAGHQNDLEAQKASNAGTIRLLNERIVGFETVDLVESHARMTILETQLQASIALTNRMAGLSVASLMV